MTDGGDDVGAETLERISESLVRYNSWMYDLFAPHVAGRVLEVGAGIGNLSGLLAERADRASGTWLTDVSSGYIETLRRRFSNRSDVHVHRWDLNDEIPTALGAGSFDTIVCLNVLEHVENDRVALARFGRLLAPGGRLVVLVPALPSLYNELDRALGHFRRYSRSALRTALRDAGFRVERTWFFNPVGIVGWYVNGTLLQRRLLPASQMRFFDRLVPAFRLVHGLGLPFGLSVVAIARPAGRRADG